jgi:hypothetical protein
MLARQRRERRLQESRVAERERQRACRQRRRGGERAPPVGAPSRAGLSPEVAEIEGKIRAALDHAARVSRATLERDLRGILGDRRRIVDPAGP